MDLLYGIRILAVDYLVLTQWTRLTDRQPHFDSKPMRMNWQSHSKENIAYD